MTYWPMWGGMLLLVPFAVWLDWLERRALKRGAKPLPGWWDGG